MKSFTVATILAVASAPVALASKRTTGGYVDVSQQTKGPDCIKFTNNEDNAWYYTEAGGWGSDSGTGTSSGTYCFNAGSGTLYIGKDPNPGTGSTKLECSYPTDGSGEVACDVSLIDGYSVAVKCTAGSVSIGGSTPLFETGVACTDKSGPDCINQESNAPTQADVDPFFQQGVEDGNNYCIWEGNCTSSYFPVTEQLSCVIYSP